MKDIITYKLAGFHLDEAGRYGVMTGYITQESGWMNYLLHIDGHVKPRRIYWRNHGNSYIKLNNEWIPVFFNYNVFCNIDKIPMLFNSDGEWIVNKEELCYGAVYND